MLVICAGFSLPIELHRGDVLRKVNFCVQGGAVLITAHICDLSTLYLAINSLNQVADNFGVLFSVVKSTW